MNVALTPPLDVRLMNTTAVVLLLTFVALAVGSTARWLACGCTAHT